MRNKKVVFSFISLLFSARLTMYAEKSKINIKNSRLTENREQLENANDTSSYETYKSFFPDMAFGKVNDVHLRMPFSHPLVCGCPEEDEIFTAEELAKGAKSQRWSVGKILNYRGLDLFVEEYIDVRPDEDEYDNHIERERNLAIYKDGKSLPDTADGKPVGNYLFSSYYYGEGGKALYECRFDTDTTILVEHYTSDSESATGYQDAVVTNKKYRWEILEDGSRRMKEITQVEFSSDFYQQSFIDENLENWKRLNTSWGLYPAREHPLSLDINFYTFEVIDIMDFPMSVLFYYDDSDMDNIQAVFKSFTEDNEPIDKYILGSKRRITPADRDYTRRNPLLKCPVIIKTSDGDVELLPDGRFTLME